MDQSATSEPRITAAAFRALAFDGVPYAGQEEIGGPDPAPGPGHHIDSGRSSA